jgi:pimeloyl-ACP methyl ester carboxylesterase
VTTVSSRCTAGSAPPWAGAICPTTLPSWAKADVLARVKGSEVPVKVITGEYDPTQPAEFMEQAWLQVYPNSELEVLRGTGHYPMFETPVALAVSIEEFLSRG